MSFASCRWACANAGGWASPEGGLLSPSMGGNHESIWAFFNCLTTSSISGYKHGKFTFISWEFVPNTLEFQQL
jgi:hypothetical protein